MDHIFLKLIWDPLTVNPKDIIFIKSNLISRFQEPNSLPFYINGFQYNYSLDMAMVKTIDIVSKNINISIDSIDIDNVLLQDFLYKPIFSTSCLNLEEFKNNWTDPSLTFTLFNKIIKDLDQYIILEKFISDNLPNGIDILNKIIVFSFLENFILNKQLVKQADK